ncbi:MAG: efflux RND transporter periplasmic adaptor subunit [Veillonellales bacterium]
MNHRFWQEGNKRKSFLIIGILLILCLAITVQMTRKQAAGKSGLGNKVQTTVDVLSVPRTQLIKRISLTGQTVPKAQVDIAAKYQGRIAAVNTDLGQRVAAGQALIVQDTGDAELTIKQNQASYQQASADAANSNVAFNANYNKAKADYDRAAATYQRYKTLYEVGGIAKDTLDIDEQQMLDAKATLDALVNQMNSNYVPATVESAQAVAEKARHGIAAAEKQRDDLILRAPFSGMIGYRQAEVGAIVSAGQKLLTIVDNSEIHVDCQVSEQDLPALSIGMDVNVQIETLGRQFPGKIIYISPASDSSNLVFSLRIDLTEPDTAVRSGMFTRTILNTVLRSDVLVVPKTAILEKNGKSYVFVINEQNVAEERTVQIGARGDQNVEILAGLTEGEKIALNNLSRLRSGLTIVPNLVALDGGGDSQ